MNEDVRWKQRFSNFEKAFLFLEKSCQQRGYTTLEAAGLVQAIEFTFELAWKTLKDFLELEGLNPRYPREVIQTAFQNELIDNGHLWIKMLDERNRLSHTYNEKDAQNAVKIILNEYFPGVKQVYQTPKNLHDS